MECRVARGGVTFVALFFLATSLFAQTATKSPAQPRADAIRAMFDVHEFEQASISPDGKRVAWVEELTGPGGAPSSDSSILIADVSDPSHPIRISAASANQRDAHARPGRPRPSSKPGSPRQARAEQSSYEEHDVAWSPDGKRFAFLSDATSRGQLQLYLADAGMGQVKLKQLTHLTGFLSSPAWSPDGKMIALLYTANAQRASGPLVAETPDEGVISDSFLEQRLTLIDVATGNARQISPADMYVYEFDWAPTSDKLVVTAAHGNGDDNWYIAELFSIDAGSGAMQTFLKSPGMQIAGPRWSPDGRQIAFVGGLMSDEPITGGDIFTVPVSGGNARNVTPGMPLSASSLYWDAGSQAILFAGIAGGETAIRRLDLASGRISRVWSGAEKVSDGPFAPNLSLAADGRTSAIVRQSFSMPPEVWVGPIGAWKQITKRNSGLLPAWGKAESLLWTTNIGTVQGWLVYPPKLDPGKKYPLVVVVHGGPAWANMPAWPSLWSYYMPLSAEGYFLFFPNPRGSYGQGENFTKANVKDFGYGDWLDILAGVDKAIQTAPVDADHLGLTGWSYGGYMTMWGVTQTDRFKAAVAGAGLSDWLSYYGENKIDQWMIPYFGASVYDDPAVYAKSSPINYIKNAKTPTLIVVGDRDGECPAPQSFEFWHALKTLGVPTQFVVYPNEGHVFADPAHNRDVIDRTVAWFNQFLQQ